MTLNFKSWAVAWGGRGYGAGDTFLRPYFWNSIKMVVPAVVLSTFIGAMTGYVLTKWRFKGDSWIFLFLLFGCFIPFQAILLPMARTLGVLGISNSILGLVLVHTVYGIPFTTLFFRNYYVSIPSELIKAARIDGAGFFKIFFKILLPISAPIIVVTVIWQFTQIWNDFLFGATFSFGKAAPIQVALNNMVLSSTSVKEYNVDMASAIIAGIPTLIVYVLAGKYFHKRINFRSSERIIMKTLKIEDLSKNFGSTEVLKKINLEIDEGNFLVLLGPSGCGKSTLLNIIAGLETINEGNVYIDDYNVSKVEPKDRNIAMVFQSYALYPSMNVKENMVFGLKQAKTSKEKIEEQLKKVSTFLQVDELLNRKPSQLSGGQRQRVAIGRALVREPRIFLFDEPLSNLDAKLRVEMRREIKKLHQRLKTTVVYVTHDQTEAMSLGTKIAIMNHGVIQQNDTPEIIYHKPSNTFVADFIGSPSMNLIKGNLIQNSKKISFVAEGSDNSIQIPMNDYNFDKKIEFNNKEVYFGIRPEHIHFKKSNENDFEVKLRADLSEYIGHEQIVTFNYSNQEILAKFASTIKIEMNKEMSLYFDLSHISLFDKSSKERI